MSSAIRLDQFLAERGDYPSRSRARDAIQRGCVSVNGKVCLRPSQTINGNDAVAAEDEALPYVSRAALKLKAGLAATGYSPLGLIALDIGASTGGFTQVLLEAGARHVIAIDVGHGQMDATLSSDSRVTSHEGVNARNLTPANLDGHAPQFIVSDVSFISLKLALPPALEMAEQGAYGIFLVKPQFEVGRDRIGKGGIVRDEALQQSCANDLANWLDQQPGWRQTHLLPSPVEGGDGNREFLLAGMRDR
ncbi:MAG: TlyA family RNA methyltransferase [Nitratireductor sp.]|nr:TlyA family RNA methyltransferase [Nitratireductor sp.]